ncbi:hypothetical protein LTR09_000310 [Extremus antarcticus]|uniref:Pentatricopeptide repeat protein n=1 Tax=Extremus antarcticus TaxID=702011 RepID=A0AAJ0GJE3_9PEZI|nr:hypothetical protein LTR09_000310 [Extremus antarcticus]
MVKRPRVPSRAALKVLTQLAYISSGTVLGAAALCAEERRRRITIVQRLADNARSIRQHPRYAGNVAAAHDGDREGFEGFFGNGEAAEGTKRWSRRNSDRASAGGDLTDERGVRGPALPSVVEEGYAKIAHSGFSPWGVHAARTPDPRHDRPFEASAVLDNEILPPLHVSDSAAHAKQAQPRTHPANASRPFGVDVRAGSQMHAPHIEKASRNEQSSTKSTLETQSRASCESGNIIFKRLGRNRDGSWTYNNSSDTAARKRSLERAKELIGSSYNTKAAWRDLTHSGVEGLEPDEEIDQLNADHIAHDVELFFAQDPANHLTESSLFRRSKIANQLLILAVRKGHLDDVRSLCLWMLASRTFGEWQSILIAKYYSSLADGAEHNDLLEFCLDVASTSASRRLDSRRQLQYKLDVLSSAATHSVEPVDLLELADTVLGTSVKYSSSAEDIVHGIDFMCRSLVKGGQASLAADFFMTFQQSRQRYFAHFPTHTHFKAIGEMIIDGGLTSEQLSASARLIRWRYYGNTDFSQRSKQQIKDFIKACGSREMYSVLVDLFIFPEGTGVPMIVLMRLLDDSCKLVFALALTGNRSDPKLGKLWFWLYKSLPRHHQLTVQAASDVGMIKSTWRSTRSLPAVENKLAGLRQRVADDTPNMRNVEDAMLEIYISAGKYDAALRTISNLQKRGEVDERTLRLAALLFARRSMWTEVDRLMAVAEQQKSSALDFAAISIWNTVVHHYCQEHSAEDTWTFLKGLTHATGFVANVHTSKAFLGVCVRSRSLDLVPQWLAYLKSIGVKFTFDSRIVAHMMTAFWHENRPKHKRAMWLCYFLHRHVPAFKASNFQDLIKAAIAYDLRNPYEQDLSSGNPVDHGVARLERLEKLPPHLAMPGWTERDRNESHLSFTRDSGRFAGVIVQYTAEAHDPATSITQPEAQLPQPQSNGGPLASELDFLTTPAAAELLQPGAGALNGQSKDEHSSASFHAMDAEDQYHAMIAEFNQDKSDAAAARRPRPRDIEMVKGEPVNGTNISFQHIRPSGSWASTNDEVMKGAGHRNSYGEPEQKMVLAYSLRDYKGALDIYEATLDPVDLPLSVRCLEVAVEACIRLHEGNVIEAEALLDRASTAGMNVTCAMGPLIIQRMRNMNKGQKRNANNLRMTVMNYYRVNDDNGWPVSHHIVTTAAHLLVTNGCPEHGVNLLAAIYKSEWAARRSLDMPAMTVLLMGYNDMRHLAGVQWVVEHVLNSGMKITRSFMRELKRSYLLPEDTTSKSWRVRERFTRAGDRTLLRSWAEQCYTKRLQQIHDDYVFGVKLEWTIKKCAKQQGLAVLADHGLAYKAFVRGGLDPESFDLDFLRKDEDGEDDVFATRPTRAAGEETEVTADFDISEHEDVFAADGCTATEQDETWPEKDLANTINDEIQQLPNESDGRVEETPFVYKPFA